MRAICVGAGMSVPLRESRIAKAMGDDVALASLCDDRPDLNEQLRANEALSPHGGVIRWRELIVMLLVAAFIGAMLAIGHS